MAGDYSVDELITAARDYAALSATAAPDEPARLLRMVNRQQTRYLTTLLESTKGAHRQATLDLTVTAGTLRYAIPTRAIAAGLTMLEGIDAAGNRWLQQELKDTVRARTWLQNGTFYVEGNELVFHRQPTMGTLRVTYDRRLSKLVLEATAGRITNINRTTGAIAFTPSALATGSFDFVKGTPHFDIYAMDKAATVVGGTATFALADIPASLLVGDYICNAGESPVCQAPLELHDVLALRLAYVWCKAKKDLDAANALLEDLRDAKADALKLLQPRIQEGAPIINTNAPGFRVRGGRYRTSGVAP